MLDLDDLLEKIPNLISRLTSFTVFSVYLLDEQREELCIAYAVGYPEEIVKHFTLQGRAGHGRHRGGGAAADPAQRRRPGSALPRGGAGREVAAGGAASQQGPGDRRAQPAQRQARRVHRARRMDPAPVRRARRRRRSPRRGCSSRSANTRRRSKRWRRSAAR